MADNTALKAERALRAFAVQFRPMFDLVDALGETGSVEKLIRDKRAEVSAIEAKAAQAGAVVANAEKRADAIVTEAQVAAAQVRAKANEYRDAAEDALAEARARAEQIIKDGRNEMERVRADEAANLKAIVRDREAVLADLRAAKAELAATQEAVKLAEDRKHSFEAEVARLKKLFA